MQRFAILTSLLLFSAAGCTHEGSALLADTWSVGPGLSETGDVFDGLADDGGQLGETGDVQDDDWLGAVDPPSEPLPPFADYAACEIDGTVAAFCNSLDPMVLSCTAIWASARSTKMT